MEKEEQKLESKDRYKFASEKSRKAIFVDNLTGGLAWGVGSIIGATIIVGLLGFAIARTREVPLMGDVIQVILNEIKEGRNIDLLNNSD